MHTIIEMDLGIVRPLETLNRFLTSSRPIDTREFTVIWEILAWLDVEALDEDSIQEISSFWERVMQLLLFYFGTNRPTIGTEMMTCVVRCARTAVDLEAKLRGFGLPSVEPIACFIGKSVDIFNDAELSKGYPLRERSGDMCVPVMHMLEFSRQYMEVVTVPFYEICAHALQVVLFQRRTPVTSEIFEFMIPLQEFLECLTHEQVEEARKSEEKKLAAEIPEKSVAFDSAKVKAALQVLGIIMFIPGFEWVDCVTKDECCFEDRQPEWLGKIGTDDCDLTMPVSQFAICCQLRKIKVDKTVFTKLPESVDARVLTLYALYVDIEIPVITELLGLELSQSVKEQITAFRSQYRFGYTIDELVSKDDDVVMAAMLLSTKDCVEKLTESRLHRIVASMLKDQKVDDASAITIDEIGAATLFSAIMRGRVSDDAVLAKILENVLSKLKEITKPEDGDLVWVNTNPGSDGGLEACMSSVGLPRVTGDFLSADPLPIGIICAWITYLCVVVHRRNSELDMCMLVDISLNWYADGANGGLLGQFLAKDMPRQFDALRSKTRADRVVNALWKPGGRALLISKENKDLICQPDTIFAIMELLLKDKDDASLGPLHDLCEHEMIMTTLRFDTATQLTILQTFMRMNVKKGCVELAAVIPDRIELFKLLGKLTLSYSVIVLAILQHIGCDSGKGKVFLENLEPFTGPVDESLIQVLSEVISSVPVCATSEYRRSRVHGLSNAWLESTADVSGSSDKIDLWAAREKMTECVGSAVDDGEHVGFSCYTCRIEDPNMMCLSCAELCHAGHDVVYAGKLSSPCACGEKCRARGNDLPDLGTCTEVASEGAAGSDAKVELPNSLIISLFEQLLSCSIREPVEEEQVGRLSMPIEEWPIHAIPTMCKPSCVKFQSGPEDMKLVDPGELGSVLICHGSLRHFVRRSQVSLLQIACVAGDNEDLLVVATGHTLSVYALDTLVQVTTFTVPAPVIQLCLCPYDPSVFACATLHTLCVFSVSTGEITSIYEVELMLDAIGPHIFINSVAWLPLAPLHLAVVCNAFVKIYDVTEDCFSPYCCFLPEGGDFITSCVFASDKNDETFGLVSLSSGVIARQSTSIEGPVPLTGFLSTGSLPGLMVLSACIDSDLLFVSSQGHDLLICRLSDLLNPDMEIRTCNIVPQYKVPWMFVFRSEVGQHFFANPLTGAIMTLEITDEFVEIQHIGKVNTGREFPIGEGKSVYLSSIVVNGKLRTISGTTGRLMSLSPGTDVDEDVGVDAVGNEETKEQVKVPPSFWALSRKTITGVIITNSDENCNYVTSTWLAFGGRRREVHILSTDQQQRVVGIEVTIGQETGRTRPSSLCINGRRVTVGTRPRYLLPLSAQEVQRAQDVVLEFGGRRDEPVSCERIEVFVIDRNKLPSKLDDVRFTNWMTEATSVFDVSCEKVQHRNPIERLRWACAERVSCCDTITDDLLSRLIRMIYTTPDASRDARTMLVKCVKNRDIATKMWAHNLTGVIESRGVHADLWPLVWRDVSLLPPSLIREVSSTVWNSDSVSTGPFAAITAFFSA